VAVPLNAAPNFEETLPMKTAVFILIVDDRATNLAVLESVLNAPDYQLVLAQSAQDALLALLNTDFAAVLLDVKMPDMTGYQLARLIHGRKVNRRLPIIFVSGHRTDATDEKLGYEAGGVDYVCKPFDPEVLQSKVAVFAELYRERVALAAEAAALRSENSRLQRILAKPDSKDRPTPSSS
jgi:DNA-binding response OmpR family regulator